MKQTTTTSITRTETTVTELHKNVAHIHTIIDTDGKITVSNELKFAGNSPVKKFNTATFKILYTVEINPNETLTSKYISQIHNNIPNWEQINLNDIKFLCLEDYSLWDLDLKPIPTAFSTKDFDHITLVARQKSRIVSECLSNNQQVINFSEKSTIYDGKSVFVYNVLFIPTVTHLEQWYKYVNNKNGDYKTTTIDKIEYLYKKLLKSAENGND